VSPQNSELTTGNSQLTTESSEPSLTSRVVKGAGWVFAGKMVGRGLQLVKLVVLARLLAPEDFGLFGIVMLAIATLQTFTQTGFGAALIQRKGDIADYLDTAWTVQVIRALVLAGVLFAVAPVVGWFFDEARAVDLLRVMCISVAIGGFANIGTIYFSKELQFHKQVLYNVGTAVVSLIVGVVLAYQLRSVWALVWAGLAGSAAGCALSYLIHPYRPHARFDRAHAQELFGFGKWMLGSSIVIFLALHGDDAFLGKVLGASALGLYQLAYRLSSAPATEITYLTSGVMMPAYAKVQEDRDRIGRAFLQVFEVVVSLTLPLTVFIIVAAPEIVLGLLGPKWAPAILPLQLLAVAGFIRAVAATGGPLFVGTGRPHMDFWMNLGRVSVIAITIYPLTMAWGVAGTSLSVVLGLAATLPVWATVRAIGYVTWAQIGRRAAHGAFLAVGVACAVLTVRLAYPVHAPAMLLVLELGAALLLSLVTIWLTGRCLGTGLSIQGLKAWRAIRAS